MRSIDALYETLGDGDAQEESLLDLEGTLDNLLEEWEHELAALSGYKEGE